MRILMILIPDQEAAPPIAPILRFERFLAPYYLFIDAGADVVLASPLGGDPAMRNAAGKRTDTSAMMLRFQQDQTARDGLTDTLALCQVDPEDFDGAFCLGVTGGVWPPNIANPAGAMVGALLAAGKPVAVVPAELNLDPDGTGDGLLITGDRGEAPTLAARALLGSLAGS